MQALLTKQEYRVPCEVHRCRKRSIYKIGNPKFPQACFNVCGDCLKAVASAIPEELLEHNPAYAEVCAELQAKTHALQAIYDQTENDVSDENPSENQEAKTISDFMTVAELKALAEQRGIQVGSKVTKSELLMVLGVE